jgi:ankyrin repeat protein
MPKNKSKRKGAKAPNDGTDDDFDRMLAEVTAGDYELQADVPPSTATSATEASSSSISSSSSSSSRRQGASSPGFHVSEDAIVAACKRGDITQVRRWGRQGVLVKSSDLLVEFAFTGTSLDILRCLVKELGADINGVRLSDGATPLYAAAHKGSLASVRCFVQELGANVNEAAMNRGTPLYIAVQMGHLVVVR